MFVKHNLNTMKKITTLFFVFISITVFSQIRGTVTDTNNKALSFVSVYLDGTVTGTTTNDNGEYILPITKTGNHTLIFQFLGYKTLKKAIKIDAFPHNLNVKLTEEEFVLDEVLISSEEDPANKIIRNVIANKEKNTNKMAAYTAKFYSRGLFKIKDAPEKILGQTLGDFGGGLDSTRSGIIYLSETISNISFQKKPKNFKEHIVASKVSGRDNGISFNRAEEANFDFYQNQVVVADANLVSPIANNAFGFYKFKLEGVFYDKNGKLINKIKITPRRENDRVFTGFIYVAEDDWMLYGVDATVTGTQVNITAVDKLHFKLNYNFSEAQKTWVLISQTVDFKIGMFGFNVNGRFSAAYSDYNFAPNFTDKTFTNEVLSFEEQATKKDSVYWNKLRPVPLTIEETKDYIIKDSIKIVRKSKKYLDSVDVKRNKLNWLSPITGYTYRNSYKDWRVSFNSPLTSINFNTVQGYNATVGLSYFKRLNDEGKWWNTGVDLNYGLSEKKLRPVFYFNKKWDNLKRPRLNISGGISTPQFNNRNPISKLYNSFNSIFWERNYLKIYEKTFARIGYSQEAVNGILVNGSLEYANRKPLFNTTDYSAINRDNVSYTANNPQLFNEHKIWSLNVGANITFGQKYLLYPNRKFNMDNNKYPSLYIGYRKTFGADNEQLNSDLFTARLHQNITVGNLGDFRYNIRSGIFLEKKNIALMDYLHANGNLLKLTPNNNHTNRFNLLDYYDFSTNDKYAEMHAEHNFKGAILGKIPLIEKLNFHLVGGAKALFTADRKPYTEYSVGIDNIGWGKWRVLRVDYVRSNYNGQTNNGFVFGLSLF